MQAVPSLTRLVRWEMADRRLIGSQRGLEKRLSPTQTESNPRPSARSASERRSLRPYAGASKGSRLLRLTPNLGRLPIPSLSAVVLSVPCCAIACFPRSPAAAHECAPAEAGQLPPRRRPEPRLESPGVLRLNGPDRRADRGTRRRG